MANTTADKLALLEATKADLKAALAEKGQTVGDVFSTYPAAVRAIETGGGVEPVEVTISMGGPSSVNCFFTAIEDDGTLTYVNATVGMSAPLTRNMPAGSVIVGLVNKTYSSAVSVTNATQVEKLVPGSGMTSTIVWAVN